MNILVVGDIHYALKQYDWLLSAAGDYDAVVIVGDLLEVSSILELPAQAVVVRRYLDAISKATRLIVCSGNHDLTGAHASGERYAEWLSGLGGQIVSDGESCRLDGMLVSVFPWWDGPETRDRVFQQMTRDKAGVDGLWLWVYHAPPANSPTSWAGTRHFGDPALGEWIAEFAPDFVLSGHVHQAPFVRDGAWADRVGGSWIFNMGQQPGPIPSYVVLNTDRLEAIWHSLAGLEHVSLRAGDGPRQVMEMPDWITA